MYNINIINIIKCTCILVCIIFNIHVQIQIFPAQKFMENKN